MKLVIEWASILLGPFDSVDEIAEFAELKNLDNYKIMTVFTPNLSK
jgi:hypothetical protein